MWSMTKEKKNPSQAVKVRKQEQRIRRSIKEQSDSISASLALLYWSRQDRMFS